MPTQRLYLQHNFQNYNQQHHIVFREGGQREREREREQQQHHQSHYEQQQPQQQPCCGKCGVGFIIFYNNSKNLLCLNGAKS